MPSSRVLVLASALLAVGCSSSKKALPSSSTIDASVVMASATTDAGSSATVREDDVRKVLEAWLAAQNTSLFSEYEPLYAQRFEGVRRSGSTQTARLDRTRWMKERSAMFKQPMTVAMSDLSITTSRDGATAHFVQTWSSGAYRDEGPKQMVFVRQQRELKIAREEMVASTVTSTSAIALDRFMFAIEPAAGKVHVVLDTKPDEAWSRGAPELVSSLKTDVVTTRKATDDAQLSAATKAWKTRKLELFGPGGAICEGTIHELSMLARVTPHFGTVNTWLATGDHEGEPKPPPAQVAQEAWSLGGKESLVLVGDVRVDKGDCKGALWARVASSSDSIPVERAKPADPGAKATMQAELRKTKAFAAIQATYTSEKAPGDPPRWDDASPTITALTFDLPSGGRIVTMWIQVGSGCGSFNGTLSAGWLEKDGKLTELVAPSSEEMNPVSAADIDKDGHFDLVFKEAVMHAKPTGKLDAKQKLTVPFLDCGC